MIATTADDAVRFVKEAKVALKKLNKPEAYNKALEGMKHDPSPSQAAELTRVAAEALTGMGEYARARVYAKNSLDYARSSGEYKLAYAAAMSMGNVFAGMNRYAAAEQFWSEAMMYAVANNDTVRQGLSLLDMVMVDQRRGNHKRALNTLEAVRRSLEGSKAAQRPLAMCYGRFAISYTEGEEFEKALTFINKMQGIAEELEDADLKARVHYNRGNVYLYKEDFPKAIASFETARDSFRKLYDKKSMASSICNIATAHLRAGNADVVEHLLEEAQASALSMDSKYILCRVKIIKGEKAAYMGNWEEARAYYQETLAINDSFNKELMYRFFHESVRGAIEKFGLKIKGLRELLREALADYIRLDLQMEAKEAETWLSKIP